MKSPFPGMDPYLERHWPDVQQSLCTYARDAIQPQLNVKLVARLGTRFIVGPQAGQRITIDDPEPQAFIEIFESDSGRRVTVVEFLSPSNKLPGDGRREYERQRSELRAAEINLVEIDLVREGPKLLSLPEPGLPPNVGMEYYVLLYPGIESRRVAIWPISMRDRLPIIPIPQGGGQNVLLDLRNVLEQAYQNGKYDRIDYRQPCEPPLEGEDAAWAEKLLHAAGRR